MNNCMIYDVKPVGDANSIIITSFFSDNDKLKTNSLAIDFGKPAGTKENALKVLNEVGKDVKTVNEFLLSHYHADHYNGLFSFKPKTMNISKLYYPRIPTILYYPRIPTIVTSLVGQNGNGANGNATNFLVKTLYFISLLSYATINPKGIGIGTGVGIVSLMKILNKKQFQSIPICEGDVVFDKLIDVIWPPKSLTQISNPLILDTLFNKLKKGLDDIHKKINANASLKEIWEKVNGLTVNEDDNSISSDEINKICDELTDEVINQNMKDVDGIIKASKSITNRFSVCLYKENDFLFLGDLEVEEVELCLRRLCTNKINGKMQKKKVKFFITPHHGTIAHYFPLIGDYVEADYIISSNGKNRYLKYATAYDSMLGPYVHLTYKNGEFIGITKC